MPITEKIKNFTISKDAGRKIAMVSIGILHWAALMLMVIIAIYAEFFPMKCGLGVLFLFFVIVPIIGKLMKYVD